MNLIDLPLPQLLDALAMPTPELHAELNLRAVALHEALGAIGWQGDLLRMDMRADHALATNRGYIFLRGVDGEVLSPVGDRPEDMLDGRYPELVGMHYLWEKGTKLFPEAYNTLRIFERYPAQLTLVKICIERCLLAGQTQSGCPESGRGRL